MKRFTITFANWDGAELQKSDWDYGSTPSYTGSTPTKAEDTDCAYTFSGWNPAIVEVTGVATYTATFAGKKKLLFTLAADGKSYSVSGRDTIDPIIVIPSEYNGLPVTTIGDYAFSYCTGLTSVTIPSSVTSIGEYAFSGCTGLTSITIPSSVKRISGDTFSHCSALTSVTIPDSVTSIGDYAFYDCAALSSIVIPDSVAIIGYRAFSYCWALTSVTIPDSVESIGVYAFQNCTGLTSISVDSANPNYQSIDGVLYSKDGKTLIAYPAGKSGSAYVIPSSVTDIGSDAFYGCAALTSIAIPASVTIIGYEAFNGCTGLTSVTIPASVTIIGDYAFCGCTGLTSVTIPASVTSIGDRAFFRCTGLASIIVDLANPNYQSIDGVLFSKDGKTLIAYPAGKSGSAYVIPSSVTTIGNSAFIGCTGLTSVTIPSSVTNVSYGAFYGCTGCAIYCEATSRPTDWDYHWNDYGGTAYWYSETSKTGCWHYVNGVPTLW